MTSPLCLLPVLLGLLLPCTLTSAGQTQGVLFHSLDTHDRLYTDNVIYDVVARSHNECSRLCAQNNQCQRFTHVRSPGQTKCRLFSTKNPSADSWQSEEGARSFFGVVTDSRSSDGPCPIGYSLHCGRCLKAVGQKVDFITAQRYCQEAGGQLVITKTLQDLQCVWDFIEQQGVTAEANWVGANDTAVPGSYAWSDGSDLPDANDLWGKGYPHHDVPGWDCVVVWQKLWIDPCDKGMYYTCQAPTY